LAQPENEDENFLLLGYLNNIYGFLTICYLNC